MSGCIIHGRAPDEMPCPECVNPDFAWEALRQDSIRGRGRLAFLAAIDRHRPIIEAAVRGDVPAPVDRAAMWERFTAGEKLAYGCGYRDGRAAR